MLFSPQGTRNTCRGTPEGRKRAALRWIVDREGIHWPDLDEDISVTEPGAVATGSNAQLEMKG